MKRKGVSRGVRSGMAFNKDPRSPPNALRRRGETLPEHFDRFVHRIRKADFMQLVTPAEVACNDNDPSRIIGIASSSRGKDGEEARSHTACPNRSRDPSGRVQSFLECSLRRGQKSP
jgi:hypothetical protein